MRDLLEGLAAPIFVLIDFALAAPMAAVVTASIVGIAVALFIASR
jgi:hypothetical protein